MSAGQRLMTLGVVCLVFAIGVSAGHILLAGKALAEPEGRFEQETKRDRKTVNKPKRVLKRYKIDFSDVGDVEKILSVLFPANVINGNDRGGVYIYATPQTLRQIDLIVRKLEGTGQQRFIDSMKSVVGGDGRYACAVSFSPDGNTIAAAYTDKTVELWTANATSLQVTLKGHSKCVRCLAFSGDGAWLASGSDDGTVKLWTYPGGALKATLKAGSPVYCVAFSADSGLLASGDGAFVRQGTTKGTVKLWDVATNQLKRTFNTKSRVNAVAFSPDGGTLVAGSDILSLWNLATGRLNKTLSERYGQIDPVFSLAFSAKAESFIETRFLSHVTTRETATALSIKLSIKTVQIDGLIISAAFSADCRSMAVTTFAHEDSKTNYLQLWDVVSGKRKWKSNIPTTAVAFSPDGKFLVADKGGHPVILDAATGKELIILDVATGTNKNH